jgi:hypothetical protein
MVIAAAFLIIEFITASADKRNSENKRKLGRVVAPKDEGGGEGGRR